MATNRDDYGHGRQGPDYCRATLAHRGASAGGRRTQAGFGQGDERLFELVQVAVHDQYIPRSGLRYNWTTAQGFYEELLYTLETTTQGLTPADVIADGDNDGATYGTTRDVLVDLTEETITLRGQYVNTTNSDGIHSHAIS